MPNNADRRPLITFALIAYNQEAFIDEAIEGAFSQTYEPLEIVLSDDCSQDNTFALMQESADKYTGPHRIILNRNQKNSGIGAHINRIMELANGQHIVIAAGDDISLPERTMEIFKVVNESKGRILAVFSDMIEINSMGIQQKYESTKPPAGFCSPLVMCKNLFAGITGASNSWDRKLFDFFGPMSNQIVFEDRVIAFRAALLGDISHIPHALVLYRRHEENTVGMFHSTELPLIQKRMDCFRDVYLNNAEDLECYSVKMGHDKKMLSKCRRIIRQRLKKYDAYLLILSGNPYKMVAGFFSLVVCRGNPIQGFRLFMQVLSERVINSSYSSK